MVKKKFYLTTAIPYVNADAIHRFRELHGEKVRIVSGADENALKNVQAAEGAGVPVQKFLDKNSKIFEEFYKILGVELDEFRRGTDKKLHWPGVQNFWKLVDKGGDIYKKKYKGLYCVGCEEFKNEKDL